MAAIDEKEKVQWKDPNVVATVAGGCFWGVEHWFKKRFGKALLQTQVGYCGGDGGEPTYEKVKSGTTGHAESVRVLFDPSKTSYAEILKFFFDVHDPTTKNRQAGDIGTQYRSAIFYHTDEQKALAEAAIKEAQKEFKDPIVTEVKYVPLSEWYEAENYHQNYLDANPNGYCVHKPRTPFKPAE